jgi:putative ABC transport system substrate-binding protein
MSYGPSLAEQFQGAALYVDGIIKGAQPADLPVKQPTKFDLLVNLRTARALKLNIPESVLLRADEIIR